MTEPRATRQIPPLVLAGVLFGGLIGAAMVLVAVDGIAPGVQIAPPVVAMMVVASFLAGAFIAGAVALGMLMLTKRSHAAPRR